MPLTPQLIDAAVERYWREIDRYEKLSACIGEACRSLLEEHSIRGSVQWRAKDPDRLRAKLQKYLVTGEHAAEFAHLDGVFRVLKDLAGARITTYVETDRVRVIALVQRRFRGFGANSTIVPDVKDQPTEFYRATHCMVRLKDEESVGQYQNLKGLACEIQVCSQLAHVYNELEHDLRYKPLSGVLSKKEIDLLNALARLMEVGDTIINQTRDAVEARQREHSAEFEEKRESEPKPVTSLHEPSLTVVADSPLLLTLASLVQASRPQRDLPETAAEFYQAMMRLLAQGAWRTDSAKTGPQPDAEELLNTLPSIAWQLFNRDPGVNRVDQNTLLTTITRVTGRSRADATTLVGQLVHLGFFESSGCQNGTEHFRFRDATFYEFLAASFVALIINRDGWDAAELEVWQESSGWKKVSAGPLLDTQAFDPTWEPLIVFAAGLINEPLRLIETLADRSKDDFYRHRFGLLCRCYRALSSNRQTEIARRMESVFEEILRIAKRCEHDDSGHRKPWLEWVEMLLASAAGAERLCNGLLLLEGRYNGWAVPLKVLELFDRVLTRGKVPSSVVDAIAHFSELDEHQWGVNTACLALRLSDGSHKQELVSRFVSILDHPETAARITVRIAEAVATSGDTPTSRRAGEMLISLAQDESLAFENKDRAVNALVSLLETSLAPIAAPVLVNNLLNPSSRHHFWLAWRIIGKAEKEPDSPWPTVFLAIILFADREDDQRLKLWSAQVLSSRSQPSLRDMGFQALWDLTQSKHSHAWVYAARWLVEHGPSELAKKAREALFDAATSHERDRRLEATAELLAMGTIDPLGGPIQSVVGEAVLRELEEHGQRYGSRLHVSGPGAPKGNVDLELFADNPAAVIKLLHTFHGPSPYLRDGGDPNEEKKEMRHWNAMLLHGTRYWPEVLRSSIQAVNEGADPDRDGALGIMLFGASGSDLVDLLLKTVAMGSSGARTRHYLLEELTERGWRFRFRGRRIEVLRKGREEPGATTDKSPVPT